MSDEAIVNPAPAGNALAEPSTDLNNPSNWDYDDEQDEAPANDAKPQSGTDPESEPDEAAAEPADQESEESEPAEQDSDEEETEASSKAEVTIPDDAIVTLPNGEKVKFSDLKKSPMFEADYRKKTQELGNQRRAISEQATRLSSVTEAFVEYLAKQIPAEPDIRLAMTDPNAYVQQKAVFDANMAQIQGLIELGTTAKGEAAQLSQAEFQERIEHANRQLEELLPEIRSPEAREKFNQTTWETARHFGFSPEELNRTADHRILMLGHYAAIGLKAEQAKAKVQQKVQAAPTATAPKAKPKGNPQFLRNKEAMRRLSKTGSINDAMSIDFDD